MAIERARFRVDTTPDTDSTSDLNGAISSTSATSVVVDDGTDFEVGQNIKAASEEMTITAISTHTLTVVRAANGTTAATHSDNVSVYEDDSPTYTPTQNPNIASEQPKEYDGVVAIGGGSAMDIAKIGIAYLSTSITSLMELINYKKKYLRYIPSIFIPTTHGTGSEVTKWATIWNIDKKRKYSISNKNLYPVSV